METEMAAVTCMPKSRGGLGRDGAKLNEVVSLAPSAARLARRGDLCCDLLWPDLGIAFEYDGAVHVGDRRQMVRDSRKRDALAAEHIDLWTVTSGQYASVLEYQELVAGAFLAAGKRSRALTAKQLRSHLTLRRELRDFHQGVW